MHMKQLVQLAQLVESAERALFVVAHHIIEKVQMVDRYCHAHLPLQRFSPVRAAVGHTTEPHARLPALFRPYLRLLRVKNPRWLRGSAGGLISGIVSQLPLGCPPAGPVRAKSYVGTARPSLRRWECFQVGSSLVELGHAVEYGEMGKRTDRFALVRGFCPSQRFEERLNIDPSAR